MSGFLLLSFCAVAPRVANAVEADASLKLQPAGVFEGARDLGTGAENSTNIGQLDAFPAFHIQWATHFATYVRGEGFVATNTNSQIEQNRTVRANDFAALREAWFEFDNLAGYPGQFLRFGRQRIKEPNSSLWWDQDIESARWAIDSTLVQAHLGVAEQFAPYRTDKVKLDPNQDHRPYLLGGLAGQWFPGHFIGIRGALADDRVTLPPPGTPVDDNTHTKDRRLGWIGPHIENGYFDYRNPHPVAYWAEFMANAGFERIAQVDNSDPTMPPVVTAIRNQRVKAFGTDTGLRFRLPLVFPANIGAGYAFGEGGTNGRGDRSETFDQTGLQSNRSRFTGTRSLINRFNEALRADLSNLRVITGYASLPFENNDASLVFSHFARDSKTGAVVTKGLDIQPTVPSHDLGNGYDLVVAHYFMNPVRKSYTQADEDTRDNLRLRASLFSPGRAYGDTPRNNQYYVVMEATVWF